MKEVTLLVVLMTMGTLLMAQNVEIDGKTKITVMDPATVSAQQVAREPDGTLSLMSSITPTYVIGDFVQGGVVFWVSVSGAHAKVVSIYDVAAVTWSNITNTAIGASAQSDINGAGNTVANMMQSGHTNSAARHCADLTYGGYDDWYLPSKNELGQVYNNRVVIAATATANGGEDFVSGLYWSSTEFSSSVSDAWIQNFATGNQTSGSKNNFSRVRAVRAF
ncbi:MAG: DUF1566 domain-containing protein [Saprospiraceae bacterium]|nr:DUF1566 domain-containing protein [Saprospiraceae bacterium]